MTALMLVSASLNLMLGGALLLLWSQEKHKDYVRDWGWSWMLLALGLILGPIMQDWLEPGPLRNLQALLASVALMSSQAFQTVGALRYRDRRVSLPLTLALVLAAVVVLASLGMQDMRQAIVAGAVMLASMCLVSGWLIWLAGHRFERWVAMGFVALAAVHISGPLLDPKAQSLMTYSAGILVQTTLSLGLILLSVRRAHALARHQGERFTRLAEFSLQGLVVMRHHRLLYANPAALRTFGTDRMPAETVDLLARFVPPEQQEAARERHARVLTDRNAHLEWESHRLGMDGQAIHLHCLSSQVEWDDEPAELIVMIDDSSRYEAVEALRRQALHDELTDLPNRNHAVTRLQQLCRPGGTPFTVLSADLDRFQLVNETLGHEAGDALLRAIARRLHRQLPLDAELARLGEDQFVVIATEACDTLAAQALAERLLAMLAKPFAISGAELFVHLSIGVALFPQDGRDAATLLRAADSAMHRAKSTAGASWLFFDATMKQAAQARLEIEQALGRALSAGEFLLEYQPKFTAGSRKLCGFEALVRWERPERGRVSPAQFIPAAERTGQIKALGELILKLACAQLQEWQRRFGQGLPVAVNVSPLQFEDPDFATRLLALQREHGLPRGLLEVEITETAAIGHVERVLPQLAQLREAGVSISLDDFGTGQSSLTMLRQLPIAAMKLDRSLITPLPAADAGAIVQAACVLGRSLKLDIVAEGVETYAQAAAAEALGCTQLQGYLLGRPLPEAGATRLLEQVLQPAPAAARPGLSAG
ncbi:EAL domain-containing protein [Pelomonas sp. SE-A7]|uniref:putative bifunctional diguanylate cyclase/phosphodiesterase n=1 Tax=Pelomonas sp. SE-A7 TaxID=3054953 RepID=UPI00259CDBC7|nr:EAL domain-containing protein [Pelomonas sp. SE-A7]MDM4766498.1 EAL domain-containing protein [Pelomonas sp. SE-A7]